MGIHVNHQFPGLDHPRRSRPALGAAQNSPDASHQLAGMKGLGHIVGAAARRMPIFNREMAFYQLDVLRPSSKQSINRRWFQIRLAASVTRKMSLNNVRILPPFKRCRMTSGDAHFFQPAHHPCMTWRGDPARIFHACIILQRC
jgi:hypothetical protein